MDFTRGAETFRSRTTVPLRVRAARAATFAEMRGAQHLGVDNAQRVFACFDQPDLKAPFTAAVTAPAGWTVVGNRARQSVTDAR